MAEKEGFLNKVNKGVKNLQNNYSHNKQTKKDNNYLKESILRRFDLKMLQNLCKYYGVGKPNNEKLNFETGNYVKVRLTKIDWIEYSSRKLSLDEIKKYAKSHRINIRDVEAEEKQMMISREEGYLKKKEEISQIGSSEEYELTDVNDLFEDRSYSESIFQNLIYSINNFQPLRHYNEERFYQIELTGWLKSHFPNSFVDIEVQKGYSRPDIIVDNVAIEIKGPTSKQDLESIYGKCDRYIQDYSSLIVVLFNVKVSEDKYQDWESAINQHFPGVVILRKEQSFR